MSIDFELNKESTNFYFYQLSKELKRLKCKSKVELIVVGGASIFLNYHFRCTSYDIDAYYMENILKQAINNLSDRLNLPNNWLNKDFVFTDSFTPNIYNYSTFYKEYNNILNVRTITREYLIAMKLRSFRTYKNDISDIVGIIKEDSSISLEEIKNAVINLYGNFDAISETSRLFIEKLFTERDLNGLFNKSSDEEKMHKQILLRKISKTNDK